MVRQARQFLRIGCLCFLSFGLIAVAAQATVPGEINYQGLLLDDVGDPVTGSVDMMFSLYSDPTGGSPLWSESHSPVSVLDGVYEVALGSTTPIEPAHLAGATVYLEIAVDGETMSPRQRLLAVPYALQAEDANSLGGLSSSVLTEIYQHFNFDGGPPNDDPREGLADTDSDGIANFVDSDNDNDGISDTDELAQGSDINLVTPTISGFDVASAEAPFTSSVEIQGTEFVAGMSVIFGSETPAASNVTATSLDVSVGPQPVGSVPVTVIRPNGEQAASTFPFVLTTPTITGFDVASAEAPLTSSVEIQGTDFVAGMSVIFGSETPAASNVTATSLDVSVGPQPVGSVPVTVIRPNGAQAASTFSFVLTTPTLTGFDVASAETCLTSSVEIQGTDFVAGMSVIFGSETPAASNVTATSLDVSVGPQPVGSVPVTVIRPNGEQAASTFPFVDTAPSIANVSPAIGPSGQSTTVVVTGTNFGAGLSVVFGSETPTPQNLTTTSFEVDVGPQSEGFVNVSVTNVCGGLDSAPSSFHFGDLKTVFVTSTNSHPPDTLGGLVAADAVCSGLAAAASLSGTYLAWLSDGIDSPDTRFAQATVGYGLVDGTVIALNWADLTDGTLLAPINLDETGSTTSGTVLSNVATDGTTKSTTDHCGGFTNAIGTFTVGKNANTDFQWTDYSPVANCGRPTAYLFCFEQ